MNWNMKPYVFVLQLVLLNQMGQGFVLLTANVDDIKKLAKKFVSESLAEKLAEFLAKATEQMITNVSEENERNDDRYQDISNENNGIYKKVRQRNQIESQKDEQKYLKIKENLHKKAITKMTNIHKNSKDNRQSKIGRVNLKNNAEKEVRNNLKFNKKREKVSEKYNPAKQYSYTIKERSKNENQAKYTEIPQLDSTIGVPENKLPEYEPKPKSIPENASNSKSKFLNPNRFRLTANSKENGTIQPNDFENMKYVLTTKKERNEFDQYDNPKYSKAEYVATSGPVVLPKIPSEDWWNEDKQFKTNKQWN